MKNYLYVYQYQYLLFVSIICIGKFLNILELPLLFEVGPGRDIGDSRARLRRDHAAGLLQGTRPGGWRQSSAVGEVGLRPMHVGCYSIGQMGIQSLGKGSQGRLIRPFRDY